MTSACVVWALASAESLGLLTDAEVLDKATTWLTQEFAKVEGGDRETRAALLHALSTRREATFEQANSLNRVRQGLSDVALAYLALTFANLDRASLGDEVLGRPRPPGQDRADRPRRQARRYWAGAGQHPWHRGRRRDHGAGGPGLRPRPAAGARARRGLRLAPGAPPGTGWQPPKAKGPALAALATFYGRPGAPRIATA